MRRLARSQEAVFTGRRPYAYVAAFAGVSMAVARLRLAPGETKTHVLSAGTPSAQAGTIRGEVQDPEGRPVAGAMVTIYVARVSEGERTLVERLRFGGALMLRTGERGEFFARGLWPGRYRVFVRGGAWDYNLRSPQRVPDPLIPGASDGVVRVTAGAESVALLAADAEHNETFRVVRESGAPAPDVAFLVHVVLRRHLKFEGTSDPSGACRVTYPAAALRRQGSVIVEIRDARHVWQVFELDRRLGDRTFTVARGPATTIVVSQRFAGGQVLVMKPTAFPTVVRFRVVAIPPGETSVVLRFLDARRQYRVRIENADDETRFRAVAGGTSVRFDG